MVSAISPNNAIMFLVTLASLYGSFETSSMKDKIKRACCAKLAILDLSSRNPCKIPVYASKMGGFNYNASAYLKFQI